MALESILHRTYTHQSDVWSYGESANRYLLSGFHKILWNVVCEMNLSVVPQIDCTILAKYRLDKDTEAGMWELKEAPD